MSEPLLTPEKSSPATPGTAQVDLASLDDKHLAQYRHPRERRALITIIVSVIVVLIGLWMLQEQIGNLLEFLSGPTVRNIVRWLHPARAGPVLLIVVAAVWAMDIVGQSTKAAQLVARAVEVTPTTFPELAPIVDELRGRFDLPRARVFISRDAPPAGYTIGVREPYSIVFSAATVGSMTPDEFKFVLGREMGHIKLGHTLPSTVFGSANPSLPMPFSYLLKIRGVLFGTYQHAQELSCDRIGVIATRDVRPALTCLIKQNFGTVRGGKIDLKSLAPQTAALHQGAAGAILRFSQMASPQPFALARLAELVAWAGEPAPVVTTTPAAPPPPTPAASAAAASAAAASAGNTDTTDPSPAATPSTAKPPASPAAVGKAPITLVTPAEEPPATGAVAIPAQASEPVGASATRPPVAATEGGSVSVTDPRPPHE